MVPFCTWLRSSSSSRSNYTRADIYSFHWIIEKVERTQDPMSRQDSHSGLGVNKWINLKSCMRNAIFWKVFFSLTILKDKSERCGQDFSVMDTSFFVLLQGSLCQLMPDMFNTHLATLNCKHKWFLSCGATKNTGPFTQRDNSHSTINTCHSEPFLFLKWLIIEMSVQLAAAVSVPLVSPLLRRHASLKALSLLVQSLQLVQPTGGLHMHWMEWKGTNLSCHEVHVCLHTAIRWN